MRQLNFILALLAALAAPLASAQAIRVYEGKHVGTLGTNSLPSFSFINDLDTGLYHPAANTLAVTTSGVARLTVDDSYSFALGANSGNPTTSGSLVIGTGGSSQLEPTISGVASANSNQAMRIIGKTIPADDNVSSTVNIIRGQRTDATALTTRDVLHVQNFSTDLLNVAANGLVTLPTIPITNPTTAGTILFTGVTGQSNMGIASVSNTNNGFAIVARSSTDSSGGLGMFFMAQKTDGSALANNTPFRFYNGGSIQLESGTSGTWNIGPSTLLSGHQMNGLLRLGQVGLAANYAGNPQTVGTSGGTKDYDGIISGSDALLTIVCDKNGAISVGQYTKRNASIVSYSGANPVSATVTPTVVPGANTNSAIRLTNTDVTFPAACTVTMTGAF